MYLLIYPLAIKFISLSSQVFLSLYPSEYSHVIQVSVNYRGNSSCNERTYQPCEERPYQSYMERQ